MSRKQNRPPFFATSAILVSVLCTVAAAKTSYVDDDATGTNNGTSWADAYTYLQDALADAQLAEKPVEIRVAQGIYKPNEGLVAIPEFDWRTATFQLINVVTLKGGYAGIGKIDPDTRDVEMNGTVLSGDLQANDDPAVWESTLDNSYHVVSGGGTDATAVLDGFTITAGNATLSTNWDQGPPYDHGPQRGGGMSNLSGNPTLANCKFIRNLAFNGGGMYNEESSPTVIDCAFIGNSGTFYDGGGMTNYKSNPILRNCTFDGNLAIRGGGICNLESNPILIDCTFTNNKAYSGGRPDTWGVTYGNGGGMDNYDGTLSLTNCTFSGNSSEYEGGGMATRGGNATLTNCRFSGNLAESGGGIFNQNSTLILSNCTLADNSASGTGNALVSYSGPNSLRLVNCIIWNGDNGILNSAVFESDIVITHSDVQGGWPGQGNFDVDPLFFEPGYWADVNDPNIIVEPDDPNAVWVEGDYHLKSEAGRWDPISESWVKDDVTSPCIDSGDPNSDWTSEVWPHGGRINMGAYGGTRQASLSIQPQEMSLPRVAYIHEREAEAAESFQSLLVSYGCSATLIGLDEVATTPLDSYDLVIVGNETGMLSSWGESDSVAAIENSGKPILGLGEGGYAFFGKLELEIGWPNGMHGSRDSIEVIDPNNSLFSVPYAIDVPDDRVLQLYTETEHVDLHLWPMPETVTALGRQVKGHGYYPLALEHDRFVLWGFTASPENMTQVGKTLFVNVVIRAANVAW
ncbi:MAG: right-handed parallel beta-helix repeat-containing protein [Planctomycetota bacterium]|jgi:hypothetical protein